MRRAIVVFVRKACEDDEEEEEMEVDDAEAIGDADTPDR